MENSLEVVVKFIKKSFKIKYFPKKIEECKITWWIKGYWCNISKLQMRNMLVVRKVIEKASL